MGRRRRTIRVTVAITAECLSHPLLTSRTPIRCVPPTPWCDSFPCRAGVPASPPSPPRVPSCSRTSASSSSARRRRFSTRRWSANRGYPGVCTRWMGVGGWWSARRSRRRRTCEQRFFVGRCRSKLACSVFEMEFRVGGRSHRRRSLCRRRGGRRGVRKRARRR